MCRCPRRGWCGRYGLYHHDPHRGAGASAAPRSGNRRWRSRRPLDWQTVCAQRGDAHPERCPTCGQLLVCTGVIPRGGALPAWPQRSAQHESRTDWGRPARGVVCLAAARGRVQRPGRQYSGAVAAPGTAIAPAREGPAGPVTGRMTWGGPHVNSIARGGAKPGQAASVRGQSNQVLSEVLRAGRASTAGLSPLSTPDSILMCYRHEGETLAWRLGLWRVRYPALDTWTQVACRLLPDTGWTLRPAPQCPPALASGQRHGASLCQ